MTSETSKTCPTTMPEPANNDTLETNEETSQSKSSKKPTPKECQDIPVPSEEAEPSNTVDPTTT